MTEKKHTRGSVIRKVLANHIRGKNKKDRIENITKEILDGFRGIKSDQPNEDLKLAALQKYMFTCKDDHEIAKKVGRELQIKPPTTRTIRNWKMKLRKNLLESGTIDLTEADLASIFHEQLLFYKEQLAQGKKDEIIARNISYFRMSKDAGGNFTPIRDHENKLVVNPDAMKEYRYALYNALKTQNQAQYNIRNLLRVTGNYVGKQQIKTEVKMIPVEVVIDSIKLMLINGIELMRKHNIPEVEILQFKKYVEEMMK